MLYNTIFKQNSILHELHLNAIHVYSIDVIFIQTRRLVLY